MHILLDADAVNFIDTSACDALSNVTWQLRIQGIAFAFAPVRDSVREQMRLGGVEAAVEPANFYERVTDGVRAWQQRALLRQADAARLIDTMAKPFAGEQEKQLKYASLVANAVMLSYVADLTDVLGGHPVTPALVACLSPYIREHIRRFGRFVLDMTDLPDPLDPQPLPFEIVCSGRGPGCPGPPAQIPACGFPAPGSCRRSNAIEVRGFGGPCTPDPQACDFGYTPHPALSPGRALLLAFPPAGRLPSTISATDLWSALFEASLVLCGRPNSSPLPRRLRLLGFPSWPGPAVAVWARRGLPSSDAFPPYVMGSQTSAERLPLA